tara:strand:- start:28162 stop:28812 length:651 start_codon:yes stop_codon:yes gene_type:complete
MTVRPHKILNDAEQAAYAHSRVRRKSLGGLVDLFRTHRLRGAADFPFDFDAGDLFPGAAGDGMVTIHTAIRITGAAPAGLVFDIGSGTSSTEPGTYLWLETATDQFRLWTGSTTDDGQVTHPTPWAIGNEYDIVVAIVPGIGKVVAWVNGKRVGSDTYTLAAPDTGWTGTSLGSFMLNEQGAIPAGVTGGAPSDFIAIAPLSFYVGSVPQHFAGGS